MSADEPLPIFLRLRGRRVLVVGAGPVGTHKAIELADRGARVVVVAPVASDEVLRRASAGEIELHRRAYEPADLEGVHLVVSATGDPQVQAAIFRDADARGLFVLAVDDPNHGSAASGAVIRRPPFLVAISSSGEAPALTRLLREMLDAALPPDRWVSRARALRAEWKRDGVPMAERFGRLVDELVRAQGR